ncbi:MAG: hypothetical protein JW754_00630 [Candidatus Aenigmarchaeota archaeon]|nr:hypothetical protein [Candidatus Aenigmarchaeota archaeon]
MSLKENLRMTTEELSKIASAGRNRIVDYCFAEGQMKEATEKGIEEVTWAVSWSPDLKIPEADNVSKRLFGWGYIEPGENIIEYVKRMAKTGEVVSNGKGVIVYGGGIAIRMEIGPKTSAGPEKEKMVFHEGIDLLEWPELSADIDMTSHVYPVNISSVVSYGFLGKRPKGEPVTRPNYVQEFTPGN